MQFTRNFGIGNVFLNPVGGLLPANAAPQQLSTIQDIAIDWSGKGVELRGQFLYAIDARLADVSLKVKFQVGQYTLDELNVLFFAGTLSTGASQDTVVPDEAHTVPPSSVSNKLIISGATEDLGVSLQSNGSNFDRVSSGSPAAGQYKFSLTDTPGSGVWQFNDTDAASPIFVSYVVPGTAAALSIPNNLQGYSPNFELVGWNPVGGDAPASAFNGFRIFNVVATGLKPLTYKRDGFNMVEVDGLAYCPTGQAVGELIQTNF